ncbi:MAG: hypothetical protein COA45_01735 [Zetaproteobacteria bacterium]|nr:MAG: hypothetical protein COA45_01735 [Zetaproteobacteria bacterium]
MINKISALLGINTTKDNNGETKDMQELHLVTAVLLVHVALGSEDFSNEEKESVLQCLKDHFDFDDGVAQKVMDGAIKREDDAMELYTFTRTITQELDQEGRQEIVKLLWKVAFADGQLDNFEDNIVKKIGGLLDVSIRDRVRLKQEVQAGL